MPKAIRKAGTIRKSDLARLAHKTPAAITKQLRNHGVKTLKDGSVNKTAALEAMAAGALLDKATAEKQIKKLEASGNTESIIIRSKMASYRRVVLQGDLLEIERDKARGDLVPMADYKTGLLEMQNICTRLWDMWIEAISAKRKDADLLEELRKGRDQVLAECAAVIEERVA